MISLPLIIAPDPIFRQVAEPVAVIDDEIRDLVAAMFETLYHEQGLGLGANMVGLLKRIIVVDLQRDGSKSPLAMINPVITSASKETQVFEEASLSYPGIAAKIRRPKSIAVTYLDTDGSTQTLESDGLLATVIQHEIDYLDGRIYLDHLSATKRNLLLKKMTKMKRRST